MVYQYKPTMQLSVPAQVAGETLDRLRLKGPLTPARVVENATPETSPLHPLFEWDDAKAATAHRETQARYLLRAIVTTYGEESEEKTVRAFVSIKEDDGGVYENVYDVMQNPLYRNQVISRARSELEQWARRYRNLEEFSHVVGFIEGLDAAA